MKWGGNGGREAAEARFAVREQRPIDRYFPGKKVYLRSRKYEKESYYPPLFLKCNQKSRPAEQGFNVALCCQTEYTHYD